MVDIFLSYKKERREYAKRLAAVFESYGFSVWWDYGLLVNAGDYDTQIENKLKEARSVIVLWCSLSRSSSFVKDEARRANQMGKMLPSLLEEGVEPPLGMGMAEMAFLIGWRGAPDMSGIIKLVEGVERKCDRPREIRPNTFDILKEMPSLPALDGKETGKGQIEHSLSAVPASGQETKIPGSGLGEDAWLLISDSLDVREYSEFLSDYSLSTRKTLARRHKRQLEDWAEVDQTSSSAVEAFLNDPIKGAELFEALADHAQLTLKKVRAAEHKAKEEHEAAERARAEERRARVEAARQAAVSGAPVSERVFRLDLPSVDNWPKPEIVAIPPGTFLMGSPIDEEDRKNNEGPQHEVRIEQPFAIGKHTVTFAEWDAAVAAGAKLEKPGDQGWGRSDRPVINVSWEDVQAYLDWLNEKAGLAGKLEAWRLPSEAEWEYTCRAGTTTPFSFGETISTEQANYNGNHIYGVGKKGRYLRKSAPVGDYPPNAFGLHQMHGNVWEWCADPWHDTYDSAPTDGSVWKEGGDASRRVLRGGSWDSIPNWLRSALRNWFNTSSRNVSIGFRLARTL